MVRISDARMSGTAFGTIVLHVAPESAIGGPLALVATATRSSSTCRAGACGCWSTTPSWPGGARPGARPRPTTHRGYGALYLDHVDQAPLGCDFDFLHGHTPIDTADQPKF